MAAQRENPYTLPEKIGLRDLDMPVRKMILKHASVQYEQTCIVWSSVKRRWRDRFFIPDAMCDLTFKFKRLMSSRGELGNITLEIRRRVNDVWLEENNFMDAKDLDVLKARLKFEQTWHDVTKISLHRDTIELQLGWYPPKIDVLRHINPWMSLDSASTMREVMTTTFKLHVTDEPMREGHMSYVKRIFEIPSPGDYESPSSSSTSPEPETDLPVSNRFTRLHNEHALAFTGTSMRRSRAEVAAGHY